MIRPLREHVLVKIKQSSIIQNDDKVGAHQEGEVVAIGDEVTYVSLGDHIIWQQYSESNIFERDGQKLTLVDEQHIMAKEVEDVTRNTN